MRQQRIPTAPPIANMTNGAVSDADAQRWATANIRTGGWYKWAEANGQPAFLAHIITPTLVSATEQQLLAQGARIDQPDCALFPKSAALYPLNSDGRTYFAKKNVTTNDQYVLVIGYTGPCIANVAYADGHTAALTELPGNGTGCGPGSLRHDPVLGDIWFSDGAGSCTDPAAPPPWCGR